MSLPQGWSLKSVGDIASVASGRSIEYVYEGPIGDPVGEQGTTTLDTFIAQLTPGYQEIRIQKTPWSHTGHGKAVVTVTYSATADGTIRDPQDPDYGLISRKWSKHSNAIQTSLLAHPAVTPLYHREEAWPGKIRQAALAYAMLMEKFSKGEIPKPEWLPLLIAVEPPGATSEEAATAEWLFSEFFRDQDASWEYDQPVLRKTELVTSFASLAAVHAYTGRIFNYPAFMAMEPSAAAAALIAADELQAWYWLKRSPDVEEASHGNFQIVQEYWGVETIPPQTTKRYGPTITTWPPS